MRGKIESARDERSVLADTSPPVQRVIRVHVARENKRLEWTVRGSNGNSPGVLREPGSPLVS